VLTRDTPSHEVSPLLLHSLDELPFDSLALIAIDIPLGLPESGVRLCDTLARKQLGRGRASSIFSAPIRPLLHCASYREACELGRSIDGRAISKQTWNILAKIREADVVLRAPQRSFAMHEVHPELSFTIWADSTAFASKKTETGRLARLELIEGYLPGAYARVRAAVSRAACRDDDILDAFAALWSAERLLGNTALTLPAAPECDSEGIRMQISA
jgi:predicted RNase H-like nuclease